MLKKLGIMFLVSLVVALLVIFFSITCNAQQRFSFFHVDTLEARVYLGLPPFSGGTALDTSSLSQRINALMFLLQTKMNYSDTSSISARINALNSSLATISAGLASQSSSLTSLSTTVGGLSTTVSGLSGSIGTLQTNLSSLTTTVAGLSGSLGTLSSTVSTTSTNLTGLTTTVAGLTTSLATLNTGLTTTNTNVTNVTATVATHTSNLATLTTAVAGKQAANTIGTKPYTETGIAAGMFARYDGTQWKPISLKLGPGLRMNGDTLFIDTGVLYIMADTVNRGATSHTYLGTDGLMHTSP